MDIILVYVTCRDAAEAQRIAAEVVDRGLAACVNIMPPHRAFYRWQGEVQSGEETAMIIKTAAGRFAALKEAICGMHSYECPCIVAVPVSAGHEPFLQWISDQSSGG